MALSRCVRAPPSAGRSRRRSYDLECRYRRKTVQIRSSAGVSIGGRNRNFFGLWYRSTSRAIGLQKADIRVCPASGHFDEPPKTEGTGPGCGGF